MAGKRNNVKQTQIKEGDVFGRLTAIRFFEKRGRAKRHYWVFSCTCGKEHVAGAYNAISGTTKSCGCLRDDTIKNVYLDHGMSRTPAHNIWSGMIQRCGPVPTSENWHLYGGRGIVVCDRWKDFKNFYADMFPRPSPNLTIDRIDVNGPYSPENCRWATSKEQSQNMRKNVIITVNGENMCLKAATEKLNLSYTTVWQRIRKLGWSVERALTEPVK